jgi:hypothetical protein
MRLSINLETKPRSKHQLKARVSTVLKEKLFKSNLTKSSGRLLTSMVSKMTGLIWGGGGAARFATPKIEQTSINFTNILRAAFSYESFCTYILG